VFSDDFRLSSTSEKTAHENAMPALSREDAPNAQTHWKISRVCRWASFP
jgi:hypothetical protein